MSVISATSSGTSASALVAGVHTFLGSLPIASRTFALKANPTELSTVPTRLVPWAVSKSSNPWEEPAPSARTSRCLRHAAGTWAMARVRTSMGSVTVLEPALLGRMTTASISWVLSHQAAGGW